MTSNYFKKNSISFPNLLLSITWQVLFEDWTWQDGTPCGIMEESL